MSVMILSLLLLLQPVTHALRETRICRDEVCNFDCNTNSECYADTIVCTNEVNTCNITCSESLSCKLFTVYSAATSTHIISSRERDSVSSSLIYCGSVSTHFVENRLDQELNLDSSLLSATNTAQSHQTCSLTCSVNQGCLSLSFGCYGDRVSSCELKAHSNDPSHATLEQSEFWCDVDHAVSDTTCRANCASEGSCGSGNSFHCHTHSDCECQGNERGCSSWQYQSFGSSAASTTPIPSLNVIKGPESNQIRLSSTETNNNIDENESDHKSNGWDNNHNILDMDNNGDVVIILLVIICVMCVYCVVLLWLIYRVIHSGRQYRNSRNDNKVDDQTTRKTNNTTKANKSQHKSEHKSHKSNKSNNSKKEQKSHLTDAQISAIILDSISTDPEQAVQVVMSPSQRRRRPDPPPRHDSKARITPQSVDIDGFGGSPANTSLEGEAPGSAQSVVSVGSEWTPSTTLPIPRRQEFARFGAYAARSCAENCINNNHNGYGSGPRAMHAKVNSTSSLFGNYASGGMSVNSVGSTSFHDEQVSCVSKDSLFAQSVLENEVISAMKSDSDMGHVQTPGDMELIQNEHQMGAKHPNDPKDPNDVEMVQVEGQTEMAVNSEVARQESRQVGEDVDQLNTRGAIV